LSFIGHALEPSVSGVPANIFFLTCDAYGVLPPISRLSPGQAMYQFISGYTAKVAGTETGITEPKPTFSACFGAPFLPLHPGRYAALLGKRIREQGARVWMINTGWSGGPYGKGKRIDLSFTRAMITAALEGALDKVGYQPPPAQAFPRTSCIPEIPGPILLNMMRWPRTWPAGLQPIFKNMPRISIHPKSLAQGRSPGVHPALDYNARSHRASDRTLHGVALGIFEKK
jgi:phosphoenolpyruvate carboxykinase (ATP)